MNDSPAGRTIRRLLAAAFIVPALLASVFLFVNRASRLAPEFLIALLVTSCGLVFAGLIWWSSRELIATQLARSLSERALARSEERFRKAFDASPAAISISTLGDGRYLDVNDRFGRLVGYAPADLRGRTSFELGFWSNPADRTAMLQALQRDGGVRDMEIAIRRQSGEVLSILLSATEVEFDGQACLLALCYDVTELKKAERALRESEASLRKAQEVAQLGGWTIDLADPARAVSWSRETHRVCGTDPGSFEPSVDGFLSLVHPSDREALLLAFRASLEERAPYDQEHRIVRPDGSIRWVREQAEVLRDPGGTPIRMVGTIQDVTQRQQLERQLAQSQKMEAVGRLAGGIAHDFNNLLSVILGYGELVVRKIGDEGARRKVGEMLKAGERAADLTRQLLAFSRRQVMVAEVLDLTQVVSGITNMLRRLIGEDIELITVFQPGVGKVRADRGQLEQVIVNLSVNARDAMPQGGEIVIEVQEVLVDRGFAGEQVTVAAGDYAVLSVRDTGVGMDAETRSHVFEPFFTTKGEGRGTGLGLATVYGIVKQSGGFVWVHSEPGQGSTFKVYLPRVEAELTGASETPPPAASPRGSETILVAEDEDALRELCGEVLASQGYHVLEAKGGEEALEEARRHGGRIHLLLTDVVMPGQNGRELAEKLTAEHAAVKVLYMSGYTNDMVLRRGVLTEGTAFIQKPFTPDGLVRRVRAVLDGIELDREPR